MATNPPNIQVTTIPAIVTEQVMVTNPPNIQVTIHRLLWQWRVPRINHQPIPTVLTTRRKVNKGSHDLANIDFWSLCGSGQTTSVIMEIEKQTYKHYCGLRDAFERAKIKWSHMKSVPGKQLTYIWWHGGGQWFFLISKGRMSSKASGFRVWACSKAKNYKLLSNRLLLAQFFFIIVFNACGSNTEYEHERQYQASAFVKSLGLGRPQAFRQEQLSWKWPIFDELRNLPN
jgi:hypothetical protein